MIGLTCFERLDSDEYNANETYDESVGNAGYAVLRGDVVALEIVEFFVGREFVTVIAHSFYTSTHTHTNTRAFCISRFNISSIYLFMKRERLNNKKTKELIIIIIIIIIIIKSNLREVDFKKEHV